jgi:hypothetical protein
MSKAVTIFDAKVPSVRIKPLILSKFLRDVDQRYYTEARENAYAILCKWHDIAEHQFS